MQIHANTLRFGKLALLLAMTAATESSAAGRVAAMSADEAKAILARSGFDNPYFEYRGEVFENGEEVESTRLKMVSRGELAGGLCRHTSIDFDVDGDARQAAPLAVLNSARMTRLYSLSGPKADDCSGSPSSELFASADPGLAEDDIAALAGEFDLLRACARDARCTWKGLHVLPEGMDSAKVRQLVAQATIREIVIDKTSDVPGVVLDLQAWSAGAYGVYISRYPGSGEPTLVLMQSH